MEFKAGDIVYWFAFDEDRIVGVNEDVIIAFINKKALMMKADHLVPLSLLFKSEIVCEDANTRSFSILNTRPHL